MTTRQKATAVVVAFVALGLVAVGPPGAVSAQEETPTPTEAGNVTTPTPTPVGNVTTPTPTPAGNVTPAAGGAATVTIENQTSDGTEVVVNSTNLPEGGFVVAYNATMAGPIGNSSFLEAGSQENVNLTLDQPLNESTMVVVVAFSDTDANNQFDLGTDEVYISAQQPVIDTAQVNVTGAGAATPTPTPVGETPTPTPGEETPTPEPDEETPTPELDE